jgi:hypothetical protein
MSDAPERQPSTAPRPCAHCRQPFRPPWPTTKFCSFACRRKAERARLHGRKHGGPSTVDISPPRKEEA